MLKTTEFIEAIRTNEPEIAGSFLLLRSFYEGCYCLLYLNSNRSDGPDPLSQQLELMVKYLKAEISPKFYGPLFYSILRHCDTLCDGGVIEVEKVDSYAAKLFWEVYEQTRSNDSPPLVTSEVSSTALADEQAMLHSFRAKTGMYCGTNHILLLLTFLKGYRLMRKILLPQDAVFAGIEELYRIHSNHASTVPRTYDIPWFGRNYVVKSSDPIAARYYFGRNEDEAREKFWQESGLYD